MKVKRWKEEITHIEAELDRLMSDTEALWDDTGLEPKEPSYLVEKTMRFEIAQKSVSASFRAVKNLIDAYKKMCQELERVED